MKTLNEIKDSVRNNIEVSRGKSKRHLGGQHCGIEQLPVILKSHELGIEISVNKNRSSYKNLEYARMLFDLIIDDLVK